MTVIFPDERIAQLWNGALEASVRRAPLESFLRSHALKVASRGPARDTDNIARAALLVLRPAMERLDAGARSLSSAQCVFLGQLNCCVCESLAALIEEPRCWRVAALVSTTQLLRPTLGLLAAAKLAATAARVYRGRRLIDEFQPIRRMTSEAIARNSEDLLLKLSAYTASRVDQPHRSASSC
jgi:hypothetical protein